MWHNRWQQVLKVQPQFVEVSILNLIAALHLPELRRKLT